MTTEQSTAHSDHARAPSMDVVFFYGIGSTSAQMFLYSETGRFHENARWASVSFPEDYRPRIFLDRWIKYGFYLLSHTPVHWLGGPKLNPPDSYMQVPNLFRANIAGAFDQFQCAQLLGRHASLASRPYALYGVSRGALALFRALPMIRPQQPPAFILLEGCPDRIQDVAKSRYGSAAGTVITYALERITDYRSAEDIDPEAITLPEWVRDVPIAFVVSAADTHVPMRHTQRVIDRVRELFPDKAVPVLVLETATHTEMSGRTDRPEEIKGDMERYRKFVRTLIDPPG